MPLTANKDPTPSRIDSNATTARGDIARRFRFWLVYLPCAVVAFFLNPTLDQLVFGAGHFGNPLMNYFHIAAFVLTTTAVALPALATIRSCRYSWLAALLLGLGSQAVTYFLAAIFSIFR